MSPHTPSPAASADAHAKTSGLPLLFGLGAYIAMIPVAFSLACVAAFGF
ncbi:MAG: hypothetical protein AAGA55_01290 [Planctomycetota bacterium]